MVLIQLVQRFYRRSRVGAFCLALLASVLACQVMPTPPALEATRRPPATQPFPSASDLPTASPTTGELNPALGSPSPVPGELAAIPYTGAGAFSEIGLPNLPASGPASGPAKLSLPYPLEEVRNRAVADGLTLRQRDQLSRQGFVIVHSQEARFNELRQRVALFYGQPYFLTSDAAYHALKISLDELLAALEREELKRRLRNVVAATLNEILSYYPLVEGSDLENQTRLAAAYLGVALRLVDPQASLDPDLEAAVNPQVEQILEARGLEESTLFPGYQDDFRAYRPSGHYAGIEELQGYSRAVAWLERVDFPPEPTGPRAATYHVPLIITLALRQANTENGPAAVEWARIAEALNFFNGLRAVGGPAEYSILMDQAFGRNLTILGLLDTPQRDRFRSMLRDLPFPQLDPVLALAPSDEQIQATWSFLGRRYHLDELILESLAPEPVSDPDAPRLLPGGLEVMAVLGAPAALAAMAPSGAEFRSLPEEIAALRAAVEGQSEPQWSASRRSLWLEGFRNQLSPQERQTGISSFPQLGQEGWAFKDLNSALGSWAELQYDTSEFTSAPETSQGIDPPDAPLAPGFVEPVPEVFYRLARLAFSASEGLKQRDLVGVFSSSPSPDGLNRLTLETLDLADRLQRLGDIAVKELRGEPLAAEDFALIQAPLGPAEERVYQSMLTSAESEWLRTPSIPGIATFDYGGDRILQVGVGGVDRIYVLTPLNGEVLIAQGGLYSYYEFSLHRSREVDETRWRRMLVDSPPDAPGWISAYLYLPEGVPIDVLAYRIGELYRVKPAAVTLSLRGSPGRDARIVQIAAPGEILEIVDGPAEANGLRWWKVRVERQASEPVEGWIYENQDWIGRAWDH